jgi:hypothetical protein
MAIEPERRSVRNRGLLTEDDRKFFRGEKDDDSEKTRNEKRHNVRERIKNSVEDLRLLQDAGEDDLVDYFHAETDRDAKLEDELAEIRQQLADESDRPDTK